MINNQSSAINNKLNEYRKIQDSRIASVKELCHIIGQFGIDQENTASATIISATFLGLLHLV